MVHRCPSCELEWHRSLGVCIRCRGPLQKVEAKHFRVVQSTRVEVPSAAHEDVPYYCLLVRDDEGRHYIRKSRQPLAPGDVFAEDRARAKVDVTVGVIGTGTMGAGIARAAMELGWKVIWKSRSDAALKKAQSRIRERLLKQLTPEQADNLLSSMVTTTELAPLGNADIVIESVIEDLPAKQELFRALDAICSPKTVLASNSSSLSIDAMAEGTSMPDRVAGMHFFNPVSRMRLVEVVRGPRTSDETVARVCDLARELGKAPIVVKDSPGFVVNRILMPYLNEAVRVVEEGTASVDDVDTAVQLGLNHPVGPLALIDLIGVDIFVNIMDALAARSGEKRFDAAKLARRLVTEGRLGRKAGKGFYES